MTKLWIVLGGVFGATGVAMAAIAAHALNGLPPERVQAVQSGVQIQLVHALALLATAALRPRLGPLADWAGASLAAGTVLFCVAVYLSGLADMHLGLVAPTGGWLLMGGWALLAIAGARAV